MLLLILLTVGLSTFVNLVSCIVNTKIVICFLSQIQEEQFQRFTVRVMDFLAFILMKGERETSQVMLI